MLEQRAARSRAGPISSSRSIAAPKRVRAELRRAAGLELRRVGPRIEMIRQIRVGVGDALPAVQHRLHAIDDAPRDEQAAAAFRRQQPLVAADGEAVDAGALDVELHGADALDAVDDRRGCRARGRARRAGAGRCARRCSSRRSSPTPHACARRPARARRRRGRGRAAGCTRRVSTPQRRRPNQG